MVYTEDFNTEKDFMNAYKGKIYYLDYKFGNNGADKISFSVMDKNLKKHKEIYQMNEFPKANFYINMAGDWLYFQNENDNSLLYRVKIDGSKVEKVYK